MNTFVKTISIMGIIIAIIALSVGVNAALVWIVCKTMKWAFAWKWVVLFTIAYAVIKSLFTIVVHK